jgi:hypothetical protein
MGYEDAPATVLLAVYCAVCARPLLDALSVTLGIGPECRKKHGFDVAVDPAARAEANKLVHDIALAQTGLGVAEAADRLRALGFARLADVILRRACPVRIELGAPLAPGTPTLLVHTPYREDVLAAWRAIPGQSWDKARKVRVVPAVQLPAVQRLLQAHYAGLVGYHEGVGPFAVDALTPAAPAAPPPPPAGAVTYAKLHSGAWGVRGNALAEGDVVTVVRRDGSQAQVTVGRVVYRGNDGVCLAEVQS